MSSRNLDSFETTARWQPGENAALAGDGCPPLQVGSLRTHEHAGARWYPEALLVSALEADVMLGFLGLAKAREIEVSVYQSSALAEVAAAGDRPRQLVAVVLRPWVLVAGGDEAVDLARGLLESALERSGIARALKVTPALQANVGQVGRMAQATPEGAGRDMARIGH